MKNIFSKYDLENMIDTIEDRLDDFDEYCDIDEYGESYRKGLSDTVHLLKELKG